MTNSESMSLPVPAFAGGTKAITLTPVVGAPRREYAEMFIPGEEALEDKIKKASPKLIRQMVAG